MSKNLVVLFDLDGTVIDSTEAIVESFGVVFDHFGVQKPTAQEVISKIGHPLMVMFESLGIATDQCERFVARYKEHYRMVCNDKTILLPNAKEAIELAYSVATLGVVTTKTSRFSKEILDHLGVGKFFDVIVGFDDVKNPKPHPEPILLALDRLQNPNKQTYMIGDTPLDVEAALAADVEPLAVLTGYATKKQLKAHKCTIFDDTLKACEYIAGKCF